MFKLIINIHEQFVILLIWNIKTYSNDISPSIFAGKPEINSHLSQISLSIGLRRPSWLCPWKCYKNKLKRNLNWIQYNTEHLTLVYTEPTKRILFFVIEHYGIKFMLLSLHPANFPLLLLLLELKKIQIALAIPK